jgi:hypothetical protein
MDRPPLPLGSYGKITTWQEGVGYVPRTKFRDFDGIVRLVRRHGKSRAGAERALHAALTERQAPVNEGQITREIRISKVAEPWFAEIETAVDESRRSPGTLDSYRSVYRRHVGPALGQLRVREVTTPEANFPTDSPPTSSKTFSLSPRRKRI